MVEGFADLLAQRGQAGGGLVLGEVAGGDFEHQLTEGEDVGGELVDGAPPVHGGWVRRWFGGRGWRGADAVDGLVDDGADGLLFRASGAAGGPSGEAAGD
ncbi:hypothetical protein [Streptomyces sp. Rer75]|uniref:hypothetical protein n=1 Tax=Streptomyces sp. Rer75 TaxID=2750011 RepID=UPI0015D05BCA|nr:hypothetical protein [Streptomyces sp. Rer75]QLH19462.1 hypothetical protein HYQ63_01365 [Streptomyces sp. Rer75]